MISRVKGRSLMLHITVNTAASCQFAVQMVILTQRVLHEELFLNNINI